MEYPQPYKNTNDDTTQTNNEQRTTKPRQASNIFFILSTTTYINTCNKEKKRNQITHVYIHSNTNNNKMATPGEESKDVDMADASTSTTTLPVRCFSLMCHMDDVCILYCVNVPYSYRLSGRRLLHPHAEMNEMVFFVR
jgi:hypothetical protein